MKTTASNTTEPLCLSCGRWTDPDTLIDGDCPGCIVVRENQPKYALATLERQWQSTDYRFFVGHRSICEKADFVLQFRLDTEPPITTAQLRERGFVEPE